MIGWLRERKIRRLERLKASLTSQAHTLDLLFENSLEIPRGLIERRLDIASDLSVVSADLEALNERSKNDE